MLEDDDKDPSMGQIQLLNFKLRKCASEASKDVKLLSDNDATVEERLQKHQSCLFKWTASTTVLLYGR